MTSANAEAIGIEIDDSEFDGFENSGSISVEAKSVAISDYGANADEIFGIFIEDSVVSSGIGNSGDVSVSAEAIGHSEAEVNYIAGIKLNYVDITSGDVENSGSITVSAKLKSHHMMMRAWTKYMAYLFLTVISSATYQMKAQ